MRYSAAGLLFAATFGSCVAADAQSLIEAPGPLAPLRGTFQPAKPDSPVVLIIPGSGPTDRDGNAPGVRASTLRMIAEGLAAPGIASARIDKRGMYSSRPAVADGDDVTITDYGTDVLSWIAVLKAKTQAKCVWVLGHSEGALVALATASRSSDICGLLLVAGPGRRYGEILRAQLKENPANAPVLDEALTVIAKLEAGERFDTKDMHPGLLPLFRASVQKFLISAFALDPAALIRDVKIPVLILQGLADVQVSATDAKILATSNPTAKLVLLDSANHMLKTAPADNRAANVATYDEPSLPLASGVAV